MSDYLNALASERRHSRTKTWIIFAIVCLAAVGIWGAWSTPKTIEVELKPNISPGDFVKVHNGESDEPPQNVYAFAIYIWQLLNHWPNDGSVDYGKRIYDMQSFVTPQCRAMLIADMEERKHAGELRERTRTISEIPGLGYADNRVVDESKNNTSWTVFLDTQVQETFRGVPVKDVYVRYPIRVVRFDVDRESNPWKLAVDCYGSNRPARLTDADLHASDPVTHKAELKTPALPGQIAPAALPSVAPLDADSPASSSASVSPAASQ